VDGNEKKEKKVEITGNGPDLPPEQGSGATDKAYVLDLVAERRKAAFRDGPLPDYANSEHQVKILTAVTVTSCEYIRNNRLASHAACRDVDTPLIVHNAATFLRTMCGKEIRPGQAHHLAEHCAEPAHVFPQDDPPLSGSGMPPVQVLRAMHPLAGQVHPDRIDDVECDVPCQFEKGLPSEPSETSAVDLYVAGTEWKVRQTQQDPYYVSEAKVERTAYRKDEYYSTTSWQSSIPLSFYNFEEYSLRNRPAIDFDAARPKATYLVDGDCQGGRRHKWYAAVNAAMDTESYGRCHRNADLADGESLDTAEGRIELMRKNRIVLVLEAGSDKDHITAAVWEALLSGAVPAVVGSSNAGRRLPPRAAIYGSDFNNWDKFAAFVKQVSEDKSLWESFHAWRSDEQALAAFEKQFEFTRTSPQCRLCRWAYAKKYGLGWDHRLQRVKEPRGSRKLCLDADKLVSTPFREEWFERGQSYVEAEDVAHSCVTISDTTGQLGAYTIDREVASHDGVTDMILHKIANGSGEVVLRMHFNHLRNSEGAYFRDTHTLVRADRSPLISSITIQDSDAKVTVLASWATAIKSPQEGIIDVVVVAEGDSVEEDEVRRIRIITEDMDPLHDKLTEFFPSSFSKLMIKDFVDPVGFYYEAH
jgi:hypothetical protein